MRHLLAIYDWAMRYLATGARWRALTDYWLLFLEDILKWRVICLLGMPFNLLARLRALAERNAALTIAKMKQQTLRSAHLAHGGFNNSRTHLDRLGAAIAWSDQSPKEERLVVKTRLVALSLLIVLVATLTWVRLLPKLEAPDVYRRDFANFYLIARAARAGIPIYESLPDLAAKFDTELKVAPSHPSPYPPLIASVIAPLSFLPYRRAFIVWAAIEMACFFISVGLILRQFQRKRSRILIVSAAFLLWWPVFVDLYQGQIMMLALLLLTGCWISLRNERDIVGGLLLGLILALKVYGGPIWVLLLILKRYRASATALIVFATVNLLSALWIGTDQSRHYLLQVAPAISRIYRDHLLNFSAFSIGASHSVLSGVVLAGSLFFASVLIARSCRSFDYSFMIVLMASAILSPVSWVHYFVTFLPVMCLLAFNVSLFESVLVGLLSALSIADASYFTPYLLPTFLRPFPLIFTVALMVFVYLKSPRERVLSTQR